MERLFLKTRGADSGAQTGAHAAGVGYACEDMATRHETQARVGRALD